MAHRHLAQIGAGEQRAVDVDGVAGLGTIAASPRSSSTHIRWLNPSFEPIVLVISSLGIELHAPVALVQRGGRLAQLRQPAADRVAVVAACCAPPRRACRRRSAGEGMSGLPKPRSITSTPARRASIFRLLMIVKTYGGRLVMRRNSMGRRYPAASTAPMAHSGRADDSCSTTARIHVVIEIPRGSRNKYEIDHDNGRDPLDRRLFTATIYPADYGFIPDTLGGDGDPLDALVLLEDPMYPGVLGAIARPVGVLVMQDEAGRGRQDHLRPARRTALGRHPRPRRSLRIVPARRSSTSSTSTSARARQGVDDWPVRGPGSSLERDPRRRRVRAVSAPS